LSYSQQLEVKRQRVLDTLQRLGKMTNIEVAPCIPSPLPLSYRNKIQCPVRNSPEGISIGLYARSSHDLVEVEKCYIHCPIGEEVYSQTRKIIKGSGIKAYEPSSGTGELRHLLIKSAINMEEVMVILVTNQPPSTLLKRIAKKIKESCPLVQGVIHNLNTDNNNVILGRMYSTLEGASYIQERLGHFSFKVSPASFFQVNTAQAESLYLKALELADLKGDETVLDAYCGVGTLSLLFARHVKKVMGIECVPEAIVNAKENAELNQIGNTFFICAAAEDTIHTLSGIDLALLNPPRKGCELSVLSGLGRLKPQTLIYVSCDPATLARDLSILCSSGYRMDIVQPFDMFPQTIHVETLVKLTAF
jgi:23S rRNA (uracil1939-C5)-methyltransferase